MPEIGRGHTDLGQKTVSWRGVSAVYSVAECDIMRALPPREAAIVHELKALFGGEILDPGEPVAAQDRPPERLPEPAAVASIPTLARKRGEPLPGQTALGVDVGASLRYSEPAAGAGGR